MFKGLSKTMISKLGYEIRPVRKEVNTSGYVLYSYLDQDGSFDYEKYRKIQEEGNKRKISQVWAIEENIAFLADYIKTRIESPKFGICHGTRRGKEQSWFSAALGCDVIGTEISDTAEDFPNTIQWDFHEAKPEWLDSVDFIYSNSFDHSYDPEKCLNVWMSCLKKNGLCIIEHSSLHEPQGANELDPFGAEIWVMPYLITMWGGGKFVVRQILTAPQKNDRVTHQQFIVIQNF
ncbi:MAG: class I SAM-dependent methyltransferase [Gammaproteobacteria bacterium]|nr:class I SAM-dependent methyltransferase [Gammaproteobacteria bacterium]